ncbi:MAG: AAA family ATPase [Geminicoccaceae bacterium]
MTYEIVDADKSTRRIPISIALAGGAGSGKTWTALMIATEIADGGKVGMVDTENGRGLEYRNKYKYRYLALDAPFSPLRYEEAIKALIDDGCKAIVVDSGSHAWEAEGGILESVDAYCQEQARKWNSKPDKYTGPAWSKFRPIHRHMVHFASRNSVPTVWCFRAREKTKIEKVEKDDGRGGVKKTIDFVPQGWQPITSDLASFEGSAFIMLEPVLETGCNPGTIMRLKVTDSLASHFKIGSRIDRKAAMAVAEFARANSGTTTPATKPERSEGAAVAQQMGIQHEQDGFVEDDDPDFSGFAEADLKRARQLRAKIAKVHSSDGVSDLDGMVMDLRGLIPDDQFKVLNQELQAKSFEVLRKEKAA